MKRLLYPICIALVFYGCKKNEAIEEPTVPAPVVEVKDSVALQLVKIEPINNSGKVVQDVIARIVNDTINVIIPSFENNKKFVVTFTALNANVTVNDTLQTSGKTLTDFSKVVDYKLTSAKGTTRTYKFNLKNFTGLPILYLKTTDSIRSKDTYVNGSVSINTNNLFDQPVNNITLEAKGRGNSTWGMPKKPYRLKFGTKAPMLGMATAKNWVLLANYSDKTLMRTSLAFDLGRKIGADFAFEGRSVELVMNGKYAGSYYLTSQVEVNENRVNITELKASNTSASDITGGYLLEQDMRLDETVWFRTKTADLPITVKSPEGITTAQLAYIKDYMQQTEDAIISENFTDPEKSYEKYINTESFINWYIVQEIMKNEDAKEKTSIFYYKNRNGKLGLGPLWDFDLGAGNVDYSNSRYSTGWWIKDGPLFKHLFKDPKFVAKVKAKWNAIKGKELKDIPANIDNTAAYLNLSQRENFKRWNILGIYVWPNQFVLGSYTAEVAQLKKWLNERIIWLDTEINKL
ncbi:MAG: CotH kinase family protein [Bacteroidota bacterium]